MARSTERNFSPWKRGYLKDIYTTGLPASCENLLWQFATIIISRVILSYGTNSYAAYQLGLQAEGVCDMLSVGFVTASTALRPRQSANGTTRCIKCTLNS